MKLHYMGKYNLDPESIPCKPHKPNYVKFKEPRDSKTLSITLAFIYVPILLIFGVPFFLLGDPNMVNKFTIGCILAVLSAFPHEILHAICFKEDVYLYTNLRHGSLFVIGPEDMNKSRFVFMSLLPNIIFGVIPYLIFVFNPKLTILGVFGLINLASGAGDYLNIFNAITQMPKGARTYLHKFNSYWYMPEENN